MGHRQEFEFPPEILPNPLGRAAKHVPSNGCLCQHLKLGTGRSTGRREGHGATEGVPAPILQYAGFRDGTKKCDFI